MSTKRYIELKQDKFTARTLKAVAVNRYHNEWVVAAVRLFGHKYYLDFRLFYGPIAPGKDRIPTIASKRGFTVPISKLPEIIEALQHLYNYVKTEHPDILQEEKHSTQPGEEHNQKDSVQQNHLTTE